MLRLRPYKSCDAKRIVTWHKDEKTFLYWGGSLIGAFPLSPEQLDDMYTNKNGLCEEEDNFYPMTAFDESGAVGHFIMRYLNGDNKILRFGWIIVDASKRGKKYGQKMLSLGLKYAFEILKVDKVTIGVIEHNIPAHKCYLSTGFRKSEDLEDSFETINGEQWKIVELEITKEEFFRINTLLHSGE